MSNADLIEQAREAIDNMDDFARMANVVATGPLLVLNSAIDALAAADKRIAELEAERPISHDDWYALCNKYDAAAQKAAELSIRCDEAERKLAVAREALASVVAMPRSAESIRRCTQALARIAATEQK